MDVLEKKIVLLRGLFFRWIGIYVRLVVRVIWGGVLRGEKVF